MKKRIFLIWAILFVLLTTLKAQQSINIWEETSCREYVSLTCFPAGADSRLTVIVCPGGSYCWHDFETEGIEAAQWLQKNGISAFVLKYRVAGVWSYVTHDRLVRRGHQYPDMMEDLQRAIQLLKSDPERFGVAQNGKLGVMGFSAGGHLAMSSGLLFDTDFISSRGIVHQVSLRPDFVVPIYPVVSMSNKQYTHKRSRRGALGEWKKRRHSMRDSLSLEKHVRADAPPVFLMNCVDDPIVKYQNSELLDSALSAKGVPHVYIQYQTGGHGFGASDVKGTAECRQWKEVFLKWVRDIK